MICDDSSLEKVTRPSLCHFDYLVAQFPETCTALSLRTELFQASRRAVPT